MKVKQRPEDFQVEELADIAPAANGEYALYKLEKTGWTTLDAIQAIRRRWHLGRGQLSYGGLKDRHARTSQYVTIFKGPPRDLEHHTVTFRYLGRVEEPYTSQHVRANRFTITLRAVRRQDTDRVERAIAEVRDGGVPDYFDDQRFGSVGEDREFAARYMVLGDYERALKLALSAPYLFDRGPAKKEKAILRQAWGNWPEAKAILPRGHARSIVDYLVSHPTDFKGAVARLRRELSSLYLSAYQSYLWNRILARYVAHLCRPEQVIQVHTRLGELPMHRNLDGSQRDSLAKLMLPLPSARLRLDPADPRLPLIDEVLADEGFKLSEMKLKGIREPFFSKGDRPALLMPATLDFSFEDDDLHAGRSKWTLSFELPRGSYATMIVKRIQSMG